MKVVLINTRGKGNDRQTKGLQQLEQLLLFQQLKWLEGLQQREGLRQL